MRFANPLPVDNVLSDVCALLAEGGVGVLVAPPGAGKTTRVPLALLDAPWRENRKIIVLEPRRIAARGAAEFMARETGGKLGLVGCARDLPRGCRLRPRWRSSPRASSIV